VDLNKHQFISAVCRVSLFYWLLPVKFKFKFRNGGCTHAAVYLAGWR